MEKSRKPHSLEAMLADEVRGLSFSNKQLGGTIGATSISAVIYCSHRAYGVFQVPMQHLGACFECTNILCNVGAKAELRYPLLIMWNLILAQLNCFFPPTFKRGSGEL